MLYSGKTAREGSDPRKCWAHTGQCVLRQFTTSQYILQMQSVHFFKETRDEVNTLNTTIEKKTQYSSLYLMDRLALDKIVTCLAFWGVRSALLSTAVCFLQMFLCEKPATVFTSEMFRSMALKIIIVRDLIKHFLLDVWNKNVPVGLFVLLGLLRSWSEPSACHPCRPLASQKVVSKTSFKSCTLQGQRHQLDNRQCIHICWYSRGCSCVY